LGTARAHLNQFAETISERFRMQALTLLDLQDYVGLSSRTRKIPSGLVNLLLGAFVYKMSETETTSKDDKISAPVGRSRGHDGTQSRELL
jgi:hypothetical protein